MALTIVSGSWDRFRGHWHVLHILVARLAAAAAKVEALAVSIGRLGLHALARTVICMVLGHAILRMTQPAALELDNNAFVGGVAPQGVAQRR